MLRTFLYSGPAREISDPWSKNKSVGPYNSEKSINGPHGSDKAINGHHSSDKVTTGSHDSDKAIRDPMQCNDKTSVVDYYSTEFIVRHNLYRIYRSS